MIGIRRGFAGLIEGDLLPLDNRAVGGIIERGGTFLGSARSAAFLTEEGQGKALATIKEWSLDGLVVIGGNGSLKGAKWLQGQGVSVVGIPASIDNDIYGTAMAIGVDTALNTVMESLDRIRDTAVSHDRTFVVEVMGRSSGYIALMGGLAGGADNPPPAIERMSAGRTLSVFLEESGRIETRLTILGHLQRGGSPSAFDRILASRLGDAAVRLLADGTAGVMTALLGQKVATLSLAEIDHPSGNFDPEIYRLVCEIAN
jgi:6-phosphofructokinase 1